MEFLAEHYPNKNIYVPTPTWGNHNAIAKRAGLKADKYRYFDPKTVGLNFAAMKEDIQNLPEGSIVLLHACAHVSTCHAHNPLHRQWELDALSSTVLSD